MTTKKQLTWDELHPGFFSGSLVRRTGDTDECNVKDLRNIHHSTSERERPRTLSINRAVRFDLNSM